MAIKDQVKSKYAEAASQVASGGSPCCGGSGNARDPITGNLYDESQISALPEEALKASLGCGNPTALAELRLGGALQDFKLLRGTASHIEPRYIASHLWLFAQMLQGLAQDAAGDFILGHEKPVMHPLALAPGAGDSRLTQIGQMPGDFWLAHLQDFDEVANANLPIRNQVQQPQARGVRQCPKEKMQ